jgi:ATP/maltotriose-dependent transcriptional regulator MalT
MRTRTLITGNHSLLRQSCIAFLNKNWSCRAVFEGTGVKGCVPKTEKEPISIMTTQRGREILKILAQGYTSAQIASKLFISERTVDFHRANLRGEDLQGRYWWFD